ncbi:aspartyl-phosphate phosphatase Spo0E family protein [Lutispora thermophila]|uniref:Spo0E like sporulation regulatory protein n=1 Tax=Lutispora thermophila DSM 19022 TaxID=1122184 RepID=A0A1M6ANB5_9FIRM|nr:aspartyl-phosphate phosphatase Spo0E family protein [Lutispora thermophila]SHI37962.1 Spo0E like sporulation regulatory protein [Lutispora thermophila DSM 19022]
MLKKELRNKIEAMRDKLHEFIEKYGIDSDVVLNLSQELDKLLCQLENMK